MLSLSKLAEEGYNAYGKERSFKTYDGKAMPQWSELTPEIRSAWEAAINAAFTVSILALDFDNRELTAINACKTYKAQFSNAGLVGHTQFLLIAKLAEALRV